MDLRTNSDICSVQNSEGTFLSNSSRLQREHCFSEGNQASPVCPSGNSNMYRKMSREHCWNDTDRGKPQYWEPFWITELTNGLVWNRNHASVLKGQRPTACALCNINWIVFITDKERVYCAVRAVLRNTNYFSFLQGWSISKLKFTARKCILRYFSPNMGLKNVEQEFCGFLSPPGKR